MCKSFATMLQNAVDRGAYDRIHESQFDVIDTIDMNVCQHVGTPVREREYICACKKIKYRYKSKNNMFSHLQHLQYSMPRLG